MKTYSIYLFLVVLIGGITSCKKLLETNPANAITVEQAQQAKDAVYAAVISAYDRLQGSNYYGRDFIASGEALADNTVIASGSRGFFAGQQSNEPGSHTNVYFIAYDLVSRANFAIKYADAIQDSDEEKDKIKGEAYFLRALAYLNLVTSYARNPNHLIDGFDLGVPLVKEPVTEISEIVYPSRATVSDCYALIVEDLQNATELLNNDEMPLRANMAAAEALLSRVYLYMGDWSNAEVWASRVIEEESSSFATASEYVRMWGRGSMEESLFEIDYNASENLTTNSLQSIYSIDSASGSGFGELVASSSLLSSYYPNDIRSFPSMIRRTTRSGNQVHYSRKFPSAKGSNGLDNIAVIRISEVYLNRAEARARQAKATLAMEDLNKVHQRATGVNLASLEGEELINAILRERRIELAFEGHRIFDLLRLGMDIVKPSGMVIPYEDYRLVARFPQSERDINDNIFQNPGY